MVGCKWLRKRAIGAAENIVLDTAMEFGGFEQGRSRDGGPTNK
jgi:hypothetical protein